MKKLLAGGKDYEEIQTADIVYVIFNFTGCSLLFYKWFR